MESFHIDNDSEIIFLKSHQSEIIDYIMSLSNYVVPIETITFEWDKVAETENKSQLNPHRSYRSFQLYFFVNNNIEEELGLWILQKGKNIEKQEIVGIGLSVSPENFRRKYLTDDLELSTGDWL